MSFGELLFRMLLIGHPRAARRRYGDEMVQTFVERSAQIRRTHGSFAAIARYPRELGGLAAAAFALRRSPASTGSRRQTAAPAGQPRTPDLEPPRLPAKGLAHAMESLRQDMRYAIRTLTLSPGFAVVAIAAIALGIGANTAIFSLVNAVILRPLPFEEPARLYSVWEQNRERGWYQAQVAAANYLDWKERASSFEAMGGHNDWLVNLPMLFDGEPQMVYANQVTGELFDVLGVDPQVGTGFAAEDSWTGAERKVLLSHAFWRSRFGGEPSVVGEQVDLAGVSRTVVGVMPPGFTFPMVLSGGPEDVAKIDVWIPTEWALDSRERVSFRRAHGMRIVGRLAADATPAAAAAELERIAADLQAAYPDTNTSMGTGITPLRDWIVGDTDTPLLVMFAAVGFVLLIACANVANMMLARAASRGHEMAIRNALGAGPGRLFRQAFVESALLSLAGGAAGVVAGIWGLRGVMALSPDGLPRLDSVQVDVDILLFAAAATAFTTLAFGIVPAWRSSRAGVGRGLEPSGASPDRFARRGGRALVVAEVALALPLVAGAGLMFRTLSSLQDVAPGFDPTNTLVAEVSLPSSSYPDSDDLFGFYGQLQRDLSEIPGVVSAAMSSRLPFRNQRWSSDFTAEGWGEDRYGIEVRHDEITPELFATMRIPVLRGRAIDETDVGLPLVVVINESLASRYFPGEDPIGQRIAFDRFANEDSYWREIIGVVGDVKRESLAAEPIPSFYAPVLQDPTRSMYMLLRTEGDPLAMVDALRSRVAALDADLPVYGVTTLEEVYQSAMARERFLLTLLGVFAVVGLVLAALGVYGVIAYATSRRTREIGVRVALGARAGEVGRMVLVGGMAPVLVGIVVGIGASIAVTRTMTTLLYGVQPSDPLTLAAVALLLFAVAMAACVVPARRALRVDPATALRTK